MSYQSASLWRYKLPLNLHKLLPLKKAHPLSEKEGDLQEMYLIQHGLEAQGSHIAPWAEEAAEEVEGHLKLQVEEIKKIGVMVQS